MTHQLLARAILLVAAFTGLAGRHQPARPLGLTRLESRTLSLAALQAGRSGTAGAVAWLRGQPGVAGAWLGPDRQTVEVRFRDGASSAILPAGRSPQQLRPPPAVRSSSRARSDAPGGRALILEPFATAMNLGPHAGDAVAGELEASGFSVTQLYDADVTLETMATLSQYNLVYIQTHSGVNPQGEAVLVTGQLASDQSASQVSSDYETMTVGVEGSDKLYEGILSGWITDHEGQFPANAFAFVNGCGFLQASLFWQALQAKGVSALASWTDWSMSLDQQTASQLFFQNMGAGMSVANAVAAVAAAGHGDSTAEGHPTAHLGYLGTGSLTFRDVLPPPPTPTPTTTTTATAPAAPQFVRFPSRVAAGSRLRITVAADPGAEVRFAVGYPNGDRQAATLRADATGQVTYSYVQRSSEITHNRFDATVRVITAGGSVTRHYRILFGPIDVSVEPRHQSPGKPVTVWVHSWQGAAVTADLLTSQRHLARLQGRTGSGGWVPLSFRLPSGPHGAIQVGAVVLRQGKLYRTSSSLRVG